MASIAVLSAAVEDAQKERLVIVLNELIQRCPLAVPIMEEQLLTNNFDSSDATDDTEDQERDQEEPRLPPTKSSKRKRGLSETTAESQKRKLYEICIQCDVEYNVLENNKESCIWHPGTPMLCYIFFSESMLTCAGNREADYESGFWDDHDEEHGVISELGDEYPEGFVWDCCKQVGTHEGCQIGRHRHTN
jgi:hypothetical protein